MTGPGGQVRSGCRRWLAIAAAAGTLAGGTLAASGPASASQATAGTSVRSAASGPGYQATIVRTAYGIPHITARNFGSLGYGYGFALASDDLCTMADDYITVEGQRSLYFGPRATYTPLVTPVGNLASDVFWRSAIGRRVIPRLLAVRTGPGAVGSRLRELISGYVAGYNRYLASVGGPAGVPDPTCRGKPWVKPITTLDAYLRIYQLIDTDGQAGDPAAIAAAQPPGSSTAVAGLPAVAGTSSAGGLAAAAGPSSAGLSAGVGSNAIAVGSAGTRDHRHAMLLGNPHFPWAGPNRFYQVQLTIPGTMNVEGGTIYGIPLVIIGFTSTLAWSLTDSHAITAMPYQLTLVPGHPTEYVVNGKPVAMTHRTVTVQERSAGGTLKTLRGTLWSTRYGPVIDQPMPWSSRTAFALADVNAANFRFPGQLIATGEAHSDAAEVAILKKYQGSPFVNTIAADSVGHALYADIQAIPDVTDAKLARCDTALGKASVRNGGPPVLDGSRRSCAWGTGKDSAVRGIFGPAEEPVLMRRDFTENSNDSYWMTNPARPLTGFAAIIGGTGSGVMGSVGAPLDLRTRSALAMVTRRIAGTDGLGPAGFTFQNMKNLMYSDIPYGATLVKAQLVTMCRSFHRGRAPVSSGRAIGVGDSCRVLAAWDDRENPGSRGAVLFRAFWDNALNLPNGPWAHPFSAASPVSTPNGLDTASKQVQRAFGRALAAMKAAHLPYDVRLAAVQYVTLNGRKIPLPGGPGDPNGEFNAINQFGAPGSVPLYGSSYIQAVTWKPGDPCPEAATVLTYSESASPASPHYADQTGLFSHRKWVTPYFCPAQVAAHAVSTTVLRSH